MAKIDNLTTQLGSLMKSKGFKTTTDYSNESINSLRNNKDLLFLDYKTLFKLTKYNNLDTLDIHSTDDGAYVSKSAIEIPEGYNCKYNKDRKSYILQNMLEGRKVESLLSMVRSLEVKPEDDSLTKVLIEANNLSVSKTIKLIETLVDNLTIGSKDENTIIAKNTIISQLSKLL